MAHPAPSNEELRGEHDPAAHPPFRIRRLGRRPYGPTRDAMMEFTKARDETTPDELWLLEHEPVYTFGQAGRPEHLHGPVDIPVVHTERGGQITYHGPGQLVVYLLVDLRRRGIKVREFVQLVERAVVEVLGLYNLDARTKPGAPGVYVPIHDDLQKIAALGFKIVNGRSSHGLSLNVSMDLAPYAAIDACGYPGLRSTDMRSLGVDATPASVGERLAPVLIRRVHEATGR